MVKYSLDTSAILDAWIRYYPIDLFPTFWLKFADSCQANTIRAIELVNKELTKKDDGCCKWFTSKGLTAFFEDISDEVQFETIEILKNTNFQRLIEERKGNFGADPFIIAHAKVKNLTLVTGERRSHSISKPKIPDVCDALKVPCINIQQLMRQEGWQF